MRSATVTVRSNSWRRTLPRAVALAVIVALLPLPALAGDPIKPAKATSLAAAVENAAKREAPVAPRAAAKQGGQAAAAGQPDLSKWSFFKSPVGIVVIGALAAGTGYAIYSASNDRIKAPGR